MRQRVRVAVDCLPARKRSLVSVVAQQLAAHASRPTAGMGSNARFAMVLEPGWLAASITFASA
jgi:hypothetical protein